jgi:hypothetical protein
MHYLGLCEESIFTKSRQFGLIEEAEIYDPAA